VLDGIIDAIQHFKILERFTIGANRSSVHTPKALETAHAYFIQSKTLVTVEIDVAQGPTNWRQCFHRKVSCLNNRVL